MLYFLSSLFTNPSWIRKDVLHIEKFADFPKSYLEEVRSNLSEVQPEKPLASVILTTYNEEANVVRCLDSISRNRSSIPFEIVIVNNNSTDATTEALEYLGIKYHNQSIQGSGPARQMGMEQARGTYILLGDADCLYPKNWIERIVKRLQRPNTAVVYGRYSFLGDRSNPRWKLAFYEMLRDISMEMRHPKRPFLNAYGISMAYYRDQGLKEGFVGDTRRGNDGRLCYDLMKYGKVRRLRSYSACVWTGTRTLYRDGNFSKAFWKRILIHVSRFDEYLKPLPQHDTKTSQNGDDSIEASWKRLKRKFHVSSST